MLFRLEAITARQPKSMGTILLIRPLSFTLMVIVASVAASVIVLFMIFGSYTDKVNVSGQLVPDTGMVKVYTQQSGVVLEKYVTEGQSVHRGDALFEVSSERSSATQKNIQASISDQIEAKRRSLLDERTKTESLQRSEQAALVERIGSMQTELAKLDTEITGQQSRVSLAEENFARYQSLVEQSFISKEQLIQKKMDLLDQRNHLHELERTQVNLARDIASNKSDLASQPLKHQNQLSQIDRDLAGLGEELSQSEEKRKLTITAPKAGIVTAVIAEVGQTVESSRPLASIVPEGALMQAQLFAPSKAIGFVRPGNEVLLRYQAFPYQKFGHAKGVVLSVSRTALLASEIPSIGNLPSTSGAGNEPLYRITVGLASQTVTTYGQTQNLQAGMLLDADIQQESRRIYEWVLEPIFSLSGKL